MLVSTLGFYSPGDGGNALYRISSTAANAIHLTGHLHAVLLHTGFVNYKMFGAKCDGKYDDGIAIKAAHQYANEARIPVVNHSGEFWIKETRSIPIQTNTQWANSVFHLDESKNTPKETHFEVTPVENSVEIELSSDQKKELIAYLLPGTKFIPVLKAYRNCLIIVKDENDRIGRRYGADYNPRGWAREEFFYVEEHGRIIGDIAWTFSDYTHLTAYPCSEGYLTVEGGTFLVSGDNPGKTGGSYHRGGITVSRSRTIVRNQWVGLEKDKQDLSLTPRSGFYSFSYVYDILLENIRLIPWEKDRDGKDRDLTAGTYGIGGSRVLCGTFRNITAEGSPVHWGVFGTNLFKNFCIESCRLNRVDVHFHGWNITIRDSEIGQKGLTLTGGGELLIENTRVFNNSFVNFRADYGAKWDGPIRITNCRAIIQTDANASLISMLPGDFDYRYPIVLGERISVDNFIFDSRASWDKAVYTLIRFPAFSASKEGGRLVFPSSISLRQVEVQGRSRGVQLFSLPDVSSFLAGSRPGGMKNGVLHTNASIQCEHIQLDDSVEGANIRLDRVQEYTDEQSLYPTLHISDCQPLRMEIGHIAASVRISNSMISRFSAGGEHTFAGEILFDNCHFQASEATGGNGPFYPIRTDEGISFANCELHFPITGQPASLALLDQIDFFRFNSSLRHNHVNTRLGADVKAFLKEKKVVLEKSFIEMLKNRSELETGIAEKK